MGLDLALGGLDLEGAARQVYLGDVFLEAAGAEFERLGAEFLHEVGAADASIREAGIVFNFRRGHQLSAGDSAGLESLEYEGLEVGSGGIERRGKSGGAGSDDGYFLSHLELPSSRCLGPGRNSPGTHKIQRIPRTSNLKEKGRASLEPRFHRR